jgi:hypothetical protein
LKGVNSNLFLVISALFKGRGTKRRLVKMEKGNDISKRTVLVLLVLTLVVSVVGTWTILSQPTTIYRTINYDGEDVGRVELDIRQPFEPEVPVEAGKVSVNIVND